MSAEVIPFPQPERPPPSCFDCEHASLGAITYCSMFDETIIVESIAEDCPEFQRMPEIGEGHG